ncbi:MAG: hypothetical protein LBQ64_03280 [Bacteroidales bacterium]|jgi:hypothetical protein|nr:hypothetical protein [Bacteroidales bacterium]
MMKKYYITIFVFSFILMTCTNQYDNELTIINSNFHIENDITNFCNKMTIHDTVFILADLSVCMGRTKYYNTLTKTGDTIYIETMAIDKTENNNITINFGKTIYNTIKNDSLNLEDLICYIQKYNDSVQDKHYPTLQITHKHDTLYYKLNSVMDILRFTNYYISIMRLLYPNREQEYPPEMQYPGIIIITENM